MVGEHLDEMGVALERVAAEIREVERAAVDQSECEEVAGCRDVGLDCIAAGSGCGIVGGWERVGAGFVRLDWGGAEGLTHF